MLDKYTHKTLVSLQSHKKEEGIEEKGEGIGEGGIGELRGERDEELEPVSRGTQYLYCQEFEETLNVSQWQRDCFSYPKS